MDFKKLSPLTIGVLVAAGLAMLLLLVSPKSVPIPDVSYTAFKQMVSDNKVTSVDLVGQKVTAHLSKPTTVAGFKEPVSTVNTYLPDLQDESLMPLLEKKSVTVTSKQPQGTSWWMALLPWILIIGFYLWFQSRLYKRGMGGLSGRSPGDFLSGSSHDKDKEPTRPDVTFADVAGQDAAKAEVAELVSFLKDPEHYRRLGAEPPHGILLMGPPGCGKTLLARALAGEAGVPFFSISASEFIEMFVGVGAARVRNMFKEAKSRAPSIIFMDELDSIGRVRGTGLGGGHDEREQTLNQILSEMDGFAGHEAVIVLAATNRPDILDPALLRPGRFDRHVTLDLPDRQARLAILKLHTEHVPVADDIDLESIAAGTPGFSGADLKNLVNEAAMAAAREGVDEVTHKHLDEMRDKVMMGTVRSMVILPEEHKRLATHEAGHTAAAFYLPNSDPLYKVTIIPRGQSLGATHMLPEEERHTLPVDYLKDRLAVMLAGRASEKLFLKSVSSGGEDDIKQATQLAKAMVSRWGMDEAVGPVDFRDSENHPFLGLEAAQPRHFSEASAKLVDEEVQALLKEAAGRAEEVLKKHEAPVKRLITELEAKETLTEAEIRKCLEGAAVVPLHRQAKPEKATKDGSGSNKTT